jgi:hypothetical protein
LMENDIPFTAGSVACLKTLIRSFISMITGLVIIISRSKTHAQQLPCRAQGIIAISYVQKNYGQI